MKAKPLKFHKQSSNQVFSDILAILATSAAVDKEDLMVLNPSRPYVCNVIKDMMDKDLICGYRNQPKLLRLTKHGEEYLRHNDNDLYKFYMGISNNGSPGRTERHKELMKRLAGVHLCMLLAGIDIGNEKPSVMDVERTGQYMKIEEHPAFYSSKEIRYHTQQQKSRAHLSRASGFLFSRGVTALVYNAMDASMKISLPVENETAISARVLAGSLYEQYLSQGTSISDLIIMCRNDEAMLKIMEDGLNEENKKTTTRMIGAIINNFGLTQKAIRYIPITEDGILTLQMISSYSRREIRNLFFTADEQAQAPEEYNADGIISGKLCYELLSSNMTKLAYIKRTFPDLKWKGGDIGILCWEGQVDFITKYFGSTDIHLRRFPRDYIETLIQGGR